MMARESLWWCGVKNISLMRRLLRGCAASSAATFAESGFQLKSAGVQALGSTRMSTMALRSGFAITNSSRSRMPSARWLRTTMGGLRVSATHPAARMTRSSSLRTACGPSSRSSFERFEIAFTTSIFSPKAACECAWRTATAKSLSDARCGSESSSRAARCVTRMVAKHPSSTHCVMSKKPPARGAGCAATMAAAAIPAIT